jgi:hypothetical protein
VIVKSLEEVAQARIQECPPRAVADFKNVRSAHLWITGRAPPNTYRQLPTARNRRQAGGLDSGPYCRRPSPDATICRRPHRYASSAACGEISSNHTSRGDRQLDHLDCAYREISANDAADLGPVEFLRESRMSHNRVPPERRVYTAFGYAVSRNKNSIDRRTRSIANRLSMYTGHVAEVPALAAKLPRSDEGHLLLNFEKRAHTTNGERVNAFGPRGLSGVALLDLGDFTSPAIYAPDSQHRATLSGMLIEHWDEHHVMVVVKIGAIVEGIRRDLTRR